MWHAARIEAQWTVMATCLADSIDLIHIDLPGMQITPSATHLGLTLSLSLSFCLALSLAQFALILSRALCICLTFHLHTMWRIVFVARSTHFFSANVSSFSNIFMLVLYPVFFCLFLTAATFSGNFLLGAASRLRLLLAKSVNGNWWTHLRIVVDDRQSQVAKLKERDRERALSSVWLIER